MCYNSFGHTLEEDSSDGQENEKKVKPMYLKDFERERLLKLGAEKAVESDEDDDTNTRVFFSLRAYRHMAVESTINYD